MTRSTRTRKPDRQDRFRNTEGRSALARPRPIGHYASVAVTRAPVVTRRRTDVLVALVALALVQLAHLLDELRWSATATFPSVLFAERNGQLGIVLSVVAFVAVATRWERAPQLAAVAGGAVAGGFVLYHGIPFK